MLRLKKGTFLVSLLVLLLLAAVILLPTLLLSGDWKGPNDTIRIRWNVVRVVEQDGTVLYSSAFRMTPDLGRRFGPGCIILADRGEELTCGNDFLYWDVPRGRLVRSILAYDDGVHDTVYRK